MYLQNTHAKTHSQYTVDIAQIFKISREGENERFRKVMVHFLFRQAIIIIMKQLIFLDKEKPIITKVMSLQGEYTDNFQFSNFIEIANLKS